MASGLIVLVLFIWCISFIRTQLVGDEPVRSSQVKQCIIDWIVSGPNAVQSLSVGGSLLTVNFDLSPEMCNIWILGSPVSHLGEHCRGASWYISCSDRNCDCGSHGCRHGCCHCCYCAGSSDQETERQRTQVSKCIIFKMSNLYQWRGYYIARNPY